MANKLPSDSAPLYLAREKNESVDSFDVRLISARGGFQCCCNANENTCGETAKCSSLTIPAPRIWRRSSKMKRKNTMTSNDAKSDILKQLDLPEVRLMAGPSFDAVQNEGEDLANPCKLDEWEKNFLFLDGGNEA
jgi:hypothetical protein